MGLNRYFATVHTHLTTATAITFFTEKCASMRIISRSGIHAYADRTLFAASARGCELLQYFSYIHSDCLFAIARYPRKRRG